MMRTGWLIPYLMLLGFAGVAPSPLQAGEVRTSPEQASTFVRDLGNRAVSLLAGYANGDAARLQTQLRVLIHDGFDLDTISRFALGSSWQRATPAQQQEYQALFAAWTADTYARQLGADRGATLTVIDSQPALDSTDAIVRTQINRADGSSIDTELRVREREGHMQIVDVTMGGVSMDVTQRDEFSAVIHRKGIGGLISDLKTHVNSLSVADGTASH